MQPAPGRSSLRLLILLGATATFLAVTIAAGYMTRLSLVSSTAWVEHTDEVKLAIAGCRLDLEQAVGVAPVPEAVDALRSGEERVRTLTADNPRQQERVARALAATDQLGAGATHARGEVLRSLLAEMNAEEGALMVARAEDLAEARQRSATAFATGAALTLLFGALSILLLQRQHRSLARAHAELHGKQVLVESIVDSIGDGVMAINEAREFIVMNETARKMLGTTYPRDRLPVDWRSLVTATLEDGTPMRPEDGPLARAVRGERVDHLVYELRQNGKGAPPPAWISARARSVLDEQGRVVVGVVTMQDVTEQRRKDAQLRELSLTDELTKLHNRRGFLLLAEQHLRGAAREKAPFALLFVDLNGLKRINDELGHEFGDRAICDAARLLRSVFRDSDVLARLGGDEFVALLANVTPSTSRPLLDRLSEEIRKHNAHGGHAYRVSMSTGLSYYDPAHPLPLQELLAEADQRMYAAKRERSAASSPVVSPVPRDETKVRPSS
jgi:diguanylate cyclase (GGDEF)-like protein